ncbi:MAG: hypothetical protein AAB318_02285, partial [Planctomycetota bacterium]
VETGFGKGKVFSMQSIKDNVSLLDAETINKINDLSVKEGQQLVKKLIISIFSQPFVAFNCLLGFVPQPNLPGCIRYQTKEFTALAL